MGRTSSSPRTHGILVPHTMLGASLRYGCTATLTLRRRSRSFTTAWVAHEEHLPLDDLWGEPDVKADDLSTLADRIIAFTQFK